MFRSGIRKNMILSKKQSILQLSKLGANDGLFWEEMFGYLLWLVRESVIGQTKLKKKV